MGMKWRLNVDVNREGGVKWRFLVGPFRILIADGSLALLSFSFMTPPRKLNLILEDPIPISFHKKHRRVRFCDTNFQHTIKNTNIQSSQSEIDKNERTVHTYRPFPGSEINNEQVVSTIVIGGREHFPQTREGAHSIMDEEQLRLLAEEVTCPLCLEIFHKPRVLVCQHTYCTECLHILGRISPGGGRGLACYQFSRVC